MGLASNNLPRVPYQGNAPAGYRRPRPIPPFNRLARQFCQWGALAVALLALAACLNTTPAAQPTAAAATNTPEATSSSTTTTSPTAAPSPTAATPRPDVVLQVPNVADTVEQARPAVVSIAAEVVARDVFGGTRRRFSSGSGVIFDPQGLVITNNHVIQGASKVSVVLDDGTQLEAQLVGGDRLSDLAVLRLPENSYPFVPLSKDVPVRVGDWAIAIGNALALPGGPSVTVGVVSALGRSLDVDPEVTLYDLTQTDTVINPGNSGGPLLNLRGELIGINTAVLRGGAATGTPIEGIGFAINMETASEVAQQLVDMGHVRWAWIGAFLSDLVPEVAARVGLPVREGVVVRDVVGGGPADQAGLQSGDIILSMNGKNTDTVSELTRLLRQEFSVDQEIDVEVFRNGSRQTFTVRLGERPR